MITQKASRKDEVPSREGDDTRNPHASATRWLHQESSSFARHARKHSRGVAAEPGEHVGTNDPADLPDHNRVSPEETRGDDHPALTGPAEAREQMGSAAEAPIDIREIACGPLINYRRREGSRAIYSVLAVTRGGGKVQAFVPTLNLRRIGRVDGDHVVESAATGNDTKVDTHTNGGAQAAVGNTAVEIGSTCLYSDPRATFWRFDLAVELEETEVKWEYTLPELSFASKTKPRTFPPSPSR
jgi:hypothetical protein